MYIVSPHKTGGMAEDVIVLLDFLGWTHWTERRSLHLVGFSPGGMIAQGAFEIENTSRSSFVIFSDVIRSRCIAIAVLLYSRAIHLVDSGRDDSRRFPFVQHSSSASKNPTGKSHFENNAEIIMRRIVVWVEKYAKVNNTTRLYDVGQRPS